MQMTMSFVSWATVEADEYVGTHLMGASGDLPVQLPSSETGRSLHVCTPAGVPLGGTSCPSNCPKVLADHPAATMPFRGGSYLASGVAKYGRGQWSADRNYALYYGDKAP
jgi:hypothetical protein